MRLTVHASQNECHLTCSKKAAALSVVQGLRLFKFFPHLGTLVGAGTPT